jgi:two-component system, OmpR family, phosphate regulon sensor histidine kinase PhoR
MTRRYLARLLGLFALLLVMHTVVSYLLFHEVLARTERAQLRVLAWDMLLSWLLAFLLITPVAVWVAAGISERMKRLIGFANYLAEGHLAARLDLGSGDELYEIEQALNQTAARLEWSFAEIESRRRDLAVMLDSMQEAVVAVSAEGTVRWSNALMQQIAGTQIRTGRALVHSMRDPVLLAAIAEALTEGKLRTGRAFSLVPGRIYEINAAPLPGGGALAVLHDVTNIEAAEQSRRDFIANVSHELRTPLTSIQGYVETLLDGDLPREETLREFLSIIHKNANRMNRLTEDLLTLATVESPNYKVHPRAVHASALIEDAIESLGGVVADAEMVLEKTGILEDAVLADPDAINQVFGNLIENAIKYAAHGGRIRLAAVRHENEVEFRVQDFGPGIASEHVERIFERFYRVDKARSRESGGTGLGLAICLNIILAHHGRIHAESELGAGTTFCFTLPVEIQEELEEGVSVSGEESGIQ